MDTGLTVASNVRTAWPPGQLCDRRLPWAFDSDTCDRDSTRANSWCIALSRSTSIDRSGFVSSTAVTSKLFAMPCTSATSVGARTRTQKQ